MSELHWQRDHHDRKWLRAWAWDLGKTVVPGPDGRSFTPLPDYYRLRPAGVTRLVELVTPGGDIVACLGAVPTVTEAKQIAQTDYEGRLQ